jgi:hypothetical protein
MKFEIKNTIGWLQETTLDGCFAKVLSLAISTYHKKNYSTFFFLPVWFGHCKYSIYLMTFSIVMKLLKFKNVYYWNWNYWHFPHFFTCLVFVAHPILPEIEAEIIYFHSRCSPAFSATTRCSLPLKILSRSRWKLKNCSLLLVSFSSF